MQTHPVLEDARSHRRSRAFRSEASPKAGHGSQPKEEDQQPIAPDLHGMRRSDMQPHQSSRTVHGLSGEQGSPCRNIGWLSRPGAIARPQSPSNERRNTSENTAARPCSLRLQALHLLTPARAHAILFNKICSKPCSYLVWRRSRRAHPSHRPACECWRLHEPFAAHERHMHSSPSTSPRRKRLPHEEEEALRKACCIDSDYRGRQGDALVAAFSQDAIH